LYEKGGTSPWGDSRLAKREEREKRVKRRKNHSISRVMFESSRGERKAD